MYNKNVVVGISVLVFAALVKKVLPERHKYEEPAYSVLDTRGGFEIRRYAPRLEARAAVSGEERDAINQGFRTLAGYIFGGNQESQTIAMTTPVTYTPGEQQTVSFVMPSKRQLTTLPKPNGDDIEFVEVPSQTVAARRFSGWSADAHWESERDELLDDLQAAGIATVGTPVLAQYDPPWTVGFLRRNEVLIKVEWPRHKPGRTLLDSSVLIFCTEI